ncbi:MAG: hypothetical protein KDE47_22770 [Caldilineaceae bacterium]|nr:hypothetical protein [Caldilineaceae bacterium]
MNEATLRAKIATLSAENRKLRRVAKYSRADALLERVRVDSQQLLVWRFSGLSIARRAAVDMGMSRRRWQWARALLQHARIHDDNDLICTDFDTALAALESSINHLQRAGLESLKVRLPQFILLDNVGRAKSQGTDQAADHNHVQKRSTSRVNQPVGGASSGGAGVDRREIVMARHGLLSGGD